MRIGRVVPAALLAAVALAGGACDGCSACGGPAIAELVEADGEVHRDFSNRQRQWQRAEVGADFSFGDGVRTGASSNARVRLSGGADLKLVPETVIRFLDRAPGQDQHAAGIDVETGEAIVEAGQQDLRLLTQVGLAIIESGSRIHLTRETGGLRYEVEIGSAMVEDRGNETELGPGSEILVSIGSVEFDREDAGPPDAGPPEPPDAGPPPDAGAEGAVAIEVRGRGVKMRPEGERRWQNVEAGASNVAAGTSIRVPRRASVSVSRGEERGRLENGEFVIGAAGAPIVRTNNGTATLEATGADVRVEVPGGVIVAKGGQEGGSEAEAVVRGRRGTVVRANRGLVDIVGSAGTETLRSGEFATLNRTGALEIDTRGPDKAIFFVNAGESFTVRDPSPPTAIGFRFAGKCPGAGLMELLQGGARRARSASRGEGRANLMIPIGRHAYQLRCIDASGTGEVVERGIIRVVRDSGLAQLPRTPPATIVDTDGRRYTVLYQNLLPRITVRWPNAPPGPYQLVATPERGNARTISVATSTHTFESGELDEGTHRFRFQPVHSPQQRSRETTLVIDFDNAAPKASVREPADGSFAPGSSTRVSGVALDGWTVTVGGVNLPLDRAQRFSGTVSVPPEQTGLAIRLSHPARGVHYYVRHGSGGGGSQ